MDLVTGAIGSLLQKLGQLLKDEYDVQTGVRKKIESLSQELESVHAVLRKIGEVPPEQLDDQVRLWARDLREASYDMEDIVDDFLIMRADGPEPAAEPGLLKRLTKNVGKLFKKSKHRHKIAGAIQEINDKLQEVAARRGRYMVNDIPKPAVPATVDPRLQAMYMKASELVGMEEQMNELVKMLSLGNDIDLSSDKSMKIVSVVGLGGLGKTTLAKVVYDKFKLGFDCGAFVPVGMHPNMKKVLRDILIGLDKRMYMNSYTTSLDEKQLIDELHEILQIKSCFIVVDDIWDRSSWAVIRCALQGSKCRSRVLITTRIYEIARHAGGDVYKMKPLSYDESRKLLYTRILGDQSGSLPTPSAVACDIILKKCGGVPLVIITSASLLANKPRECWSEMMISFDDLEHAAMHHTPRIMCLSYYNLPLHLRPCLLYLSIFPEDYYIEKKMLIWRWVAEGFIQEKQEADIGLFEIGEGYFNELINRSLIQPVEDEYSGCVNGCRVHDIMLDIMCLLSAKENFVTIANASWEREIQRNNVRRLVLHNYWGLKESGHRLADMELKQLRTFVTNECSASDINKKLPSFQVLRVLETENRNNLITESEINLRHVGSLLHLRYLSLQKVDSSSLPEDVGNLKLLLVLDVQYSNIRDLPESVGQMTKLLCLRVDFDARVSPSAIGKLTSLQELRMKPRMDDRWQFVKVLGKLKELRMLQTSLYLDGLANGTSSLLESLCNLHKLLNVEIEGHFYQRVGVAWESGFASPQRLRYLCLTSLRFHRMPVWMMNSSLLVNLSYLNLRVHVLDGQDMEALGRLPKLRYLKLHTEYDGIVLVSGDKIIPGDGYFQELRFLIAPNMCVLFYQNAVMPNLKVLEFSVYVRILQDADLLPGFEKLLSFAHLGTNSLQRVQVRINCRGGRPAEVEQVEAALAHAATVHPNRLTLHTTRLWEDEMLSPYEEHSGLFPKVVVENVNVRKRKSAHLRSDICWMLKRNPCVKKFSVSINCANASLEEVEKAEADVRFAVDVHANRPTLKLTRYGEDMMVLSDQHQKA